MEDQSNTADESSVVFMAVIPSIYTLNSYSTGASCKVTKLEASQVSVVFNLLGLSFRKTTQNSPNSSSKNVKVNINYKIYLGVRQSLNHFKNQPVHTYCASRHWLSWLNQKAQCRQIDT